MRIKRLLVAVTGFMLVISWVAGASASENFMQVDLSRQIRARVEIISSIQANAGKSLRMINSRQQEVVHKVQTTDDPGELQALKREYLELRSGWLNVHQARITDMEEQLAGMAYDIQRLNAIYHDRQEYGLGAGLRREDPAARKSVGAMFGGFAAAIKMVETCDPGADLTSQKIALNNLDQRARRFFTTSGETSLDGQLEFVKDCMVLAQSLKQLFASEGDYLRQRMVEVELDRLKTGISTVAVGTPRGFEASDEAVFGRTVHLSPKGRASKVDHRGWGIY